MHMFYEVVFFILISIVGQAKRSLRLYDKLVIHSVISSTVLQAVFYYWRKRTCNRLYLLMEKAHVAGLQNGEIF